MVAMPSIWRIVRSTASNASSKSARSNRANAIVLERFATHFNYEPMAFDAVDAQGRAVCHTNVLMCVATDVALVGLELIADVARRAEVRQRLEETGREVVALSAAQIGNFAGNALELSNGQERLLALSSRALQSLQPQQIKTLERSARLVPLSVPTIEPAGGSVHCMLAGVHLAPR